MIAAVIFAALLLVIALTLGWLLEEQWFVLLLDFLRLRRGVWIQHSDGETRAQFMRRNAFGQLWCHRIGTIGSAILLPEGKIQGLSYVRRWKPMSDRP